jgi:hypothetical protein
LVQNIIDTIVDVIQGLLAGIGSGIVTYFESTFLTETGDLNSVGTFIFVLLGIGAAFGLAKLVFSLVRFRR